MSETLIGRIFGENIDNSFTFASKQLIDDSFVKVNKEDDCHSYLIGKVCKRVVHNPYCTTPEVIRYVNDDYDFHKDSLYIYNVDTLGTINRGKLSSDRIPALPGSAVYLASNKDIKTIYGIQAGDIDIGCLIDSSNCSVSVDINKLFNPHLFIVGKTGSGKSHFVKQLLKNTKECFWVFSPTDEYNHLSDSQNCKCVRNVSVPWNIDSMSYYLDLNASEETILYNAKEIIEKLFEADDSKCINCDDIDKSIKEYYSSIEKTLQPQMNIYDLISPDTASVEITNELPRFANSLINKLKRFRNLTFRQKASIGDMATTSVVFDLGNYSQLEQEWIIGSMLFQLKNSLTHSQSDRKHLIILEEAHNYVPSEKHTKCKNEIVKMSREGRKYGASLCFITQRPRFFDQTALAQSGNRVVFSLSNPDDIKHVMDEASIYDKELLGVIPRQRQGECAIIGDAFNGIVNVKINNS